MFSIILGSLALTTVFVLLCQAVYFLRKNIKVSPLSFFFITLSYAFMMVPAAIKMLTE